MSNFDGCQLPSVPKLSEGIASSTNQTFIERIKRLLALPWNRYVKKWLKQVYYLSIRRQASLRAQISARDFFQVVPFKNGNLMKAYMSRINEFAYRQAIQFKKGDLVKVRSREEISSTLDPFKELKGCAFLPEMYKYCGTQQRVLRSMQYFMDERDYKLKKVHGVVLLENVICNGTPTFGNCDRCCFLFWREEWLEKVPEE